MYIVTKPASEGKHYVYVVASRRDGKKVRQEQVAYLGALEDDRIPYLKAAFERKDRRPLLVSKNGKE